MVIFSNLDLVSRAVLLNTFARNKITLLQCETPSLECPINGAGVNRNTPVLFQVGLEFTKVQVWGPFDK